MNMHVGGGFKVGQIVNWTRVRGEFDGSTIEAIEEQNGYGWPVTIRATNGQKTYVAYSELELAPRFAVGDKVRWNGESGSFFTKNGVYQISRADDGGDSFTDNEQTTPEKAKHWAGYEWLAANFTLATTYSSCAAAEVDNLADEYGSPKPWTSEPKYREGDTVRVVRHCNWRGRDISMGVPVGETRKIARKTAQLAAEGIDTFSIEGDDRYFYTPLNFELVAVAQATAPTLRIEAGKFYKTRDGRKVGPMLNNSGNEFWPFMAGSLFERDFWKSDGTAYWGNDAKGDVIAEWHTPTTMADIVRKHSSEGTAIVALIENGRPKPSTVPYVHADRYGATAEASRLAGIHKGQQFGVYELVDVKKVEKAYDHEWQRLAANGQKLAAIKELRGMTGLGLATTKDAVEDWLRREDSMRAA